MSGKSLICTKAGNKVQSISEAIIDDFFHLAGYYPIYEPTIELDDLTFKPDWVLLPHKELDKPVIVEYWGLLRKENRAAWVIGRLPHYLERKELKERVYLSSDKYDFLGIYPEEIDDLERVFTKFLNNGVTSLNT